MTTANEKDMKIWWIPQLGMKGSSRFPCGASKKRNS